MSHLRGPVCLVVLEDFSPDEFNIACIPTPFILKNCHEGQLLTPPEFSFHTHKITGQVGIAVEDEESLSEERPCFSNGSGGAQESRSIECVLNLEPEEPAIPDRFPNHLALMTYAKDHTLDSLCSQQAKLVNHESLSIHWNQSLGHVARDRAHPSPQTTRDYRHRQHRNHE